MNELVEAVNSQNKQIIQESMENITDKIDQQNQVIKNLSNKIERMGKRHLQKLTKLKGKQNQSLWDKVKNIFK